MVAVDPAGGPRERERDRSRSPVSTRARGERRGERRGVWKAEEAAPVAPATVPSSAVECGGGRFRREVDAGVARFGARGVREVPRVGDMGGEVSWVKRGRGSESEGPAGGSRGGRVWGGGRKRWGTYIRWMGDTVPTYFCYGVDDIQFGTGRGDEGMEGEGGARRGVLGRSRRGGWGMRATKRHAAGLVVIQCYAYNNTYRRPGPRARRCSWSGVASQREGDQLGREREMTRERSRGEKFG